MRGRRARWARLGRLARDAGLAKGATLGRFAWLAMVLGLLLNMSVLAQQRASNQFEPKSGRPGKDVEWVPTPQVLVEKMLDLAQVTARDYVIDLGSGDGRTVIAAAERGARAHGIEFDPE